MLAMLNLVKLKCFQSNKTSWCPNFQYIYIYDNKKKVEQLKMNHMFNTIHGNLSAYLKEDISLQDNTSHQTRSATSLSCQTPRVNFRVQASHWPCWPP